MPDPNALASELEALLMHFCQAYRLYVSGPPAYGSTQAGKAPGVAKHHRTAVALKEFRFVQRAAPSFHNHGGD